MSDDAVTDDGRFAVHLPVNEVTPRVVQGEGPYCGRAAVFVRLGLCNLHCPGCDQADTWDGKRFDLRATNPMTSVKDIMARIGPRPPMVVLTGGEPLIWQRTGAFTTLLEHLADVCPVHVETNGTIAPTVAVADMVHHFTVSPKIGPLASSDDSKARRIRPAVLSGFERLAATGRACFKFVCSDEYDVRRVADLCADLHIRTHRVWIMPYGAETGEVLMVGRKITPPALALGFNVTTRLHLLLGTR